MGKFLIFQSSVVMSIIILNLISHLCSEKHGNSENIDGSRRVNISLEDLCHCTVGIRHRSLKYYILCNFFQEESTCINAYCDIRKTHNNSHYCYDVHSPVWDSAHLLMIFMSGFFLTLQNNQLINDVFYVVTEK